MKAYIFTPGDLICRKGEVAREMFIIADGILEVISETGKVLTTMKAGDFFGEIGILNLDGLNKSGRRTADVRSVGYSELFSLSREDVLAAMKDYPEAQEILQSLGRKRLMDARHNSKSGSSSSSKRDSPSPIKETVPEERQSKKIVSRLKSDVSAIRNAFRKSRGTTREMETVELEPLTSDGKSSTENDGAVVKRLLKRFGKDEGNISSDASVSTSRAVLKRMAKVSNDGVQPATTSQPSRETSVEEPHGVLGAGLPLIQRLKLLKEKEDKEEKERSRNKDEATVPDPAQNRLKTDVVDDDSGKIGANLPLLARLKLLKVKEDKDKLERENSIAVQSSLSKCSIDVNMVENAKKVEEKIQNDSSKEGEPSNILTAVTNITRPANQLKGMLRKAVLENNSNGDKIIVSNQCERTQINDLNKDTEPREERIGNNNTIINKDIFTKPGILTNSLEVPKDGNASNDTSDSKNIIEKEIQTSSSQEKSEDSDDSQKDGVQRSASFRRAMGESLLGSGKKDHNIKDNGSNGKRKASTSSSSTCSSKNSVDDAENLSKQVKLTTFVTSKDEGGTMLVHKQRDSITKIFVMDEGSPEDNTVRRVSQADLLKVPSDEISPPLSSPESTDTPERKSLKSILKKMSREDSRGHLTPGSELKKMMGNQTIEGFLARRSKFSKSVSFIRRTLNSPPHTLESIIRRSGSSEDSKINKKLYRQVSLSIQPTQPNHMNAMNVLDPRDTVSTDGMNKLLTKLGSIGTSPIEASGSETLIHGVRKILQDKMLLPGNGNRWNHRNISSKH
uniref:Cyclic-nucleotide-gated cation channel n=1 Tax=Hirondellea gigas TaxID=1518452 RepID=A0A6A7G5W7_9CRUS